MSLSLSCTLRVALAPRAKGMKRHSRPPFLCDGRPLRASSPPLFQPVSLRRLLSFLLSAAAGENQRSVASLMLLKPKPWRYVQLICETCSELKSRMAARVTEAVPASKDDKVMYRGRDTSSLLTSFITEYTLRCLLALSLKLG